MVARFGPNVWDEENRYAGAFEVLTAETFDTFFIAAEKAAGVEEDGLSIMCSSVMDFPEEATANADTIALARLIRA